jgi:hypothetical protein
VPPPAPLRDAFQAYLYHCAFDLLHEAHIADWPPAEPIAIFAHDGKFRIKVSVEAGQPNDPLRLPETLPLAGSVPAALTKIERAMQIYLRDPGQSLRDVARQVPCAPSLLYGSKAMRRLRQAHVRDRRSP